MTRPLLFPGIIVLLVCCCLGGVARGRSFNWIDEQGFHAADAIGKVPLEHRRELPEARHKESFPFTEEEDRDGSMYIWYILNEAGYPFPYTAAKDVPKSTLLGRVNVPHTGDVAWWRSGYVALTNGKSEVMTAARSIPLARLEKKLGKPVWYRPDFPEQAASPAATAPREVLSEADAVLAGLKAAAVFPPRVKDEAEFQELKREWKRGEAKMERLRTQHPLAPQLLAKIGEMYRLGHNLDIQGSWERAEAFLLKAEVLAPDLFDPYFSLGCHYTDTHFDYAPRGETQLRKAHSLARGKEEIQALRGLAMALYMNGKKQEAVRALDRISELEPENAEVRELRSSMMRQDRKKTATAP